VGFYSGVVMTNDEFAEMNKVLVCSTAVQLPDVRMKGWKKFLLVGK